MDRNRTQGAARLVRDGSRIRVNGNNRSVELVAKTRLTVALLVRRRVREVG